MDWHSGSDTLHNDGFILPDMHNETSVSTFFLTQFLTSLLWVGPVVLARRITV